MHQPQRHMTEPRPSWIWNSVYACSPPMLPLKRNGKYVVCVSGTSQGFGVVSGVRKPDGITVHADGRCVFSEYAGGFDGFWSTDAGDGHEDGLALAAKRVWPLPSADAPAVLHDLFLLLQHKSKR